MTPNLGASQLEAMLRRAGGKVVSFDSASTIGLVDRAGAELLPGMASQSYEGVNTTVVIIAGSLGEITPGADMMVDGTSMKLRRIEPIEDGSLSLLYVMNGGL